MTTEEDFQRALDAQPEDWQTRLVFADWLDERGDPRAEGYRALGVGRVRPMQFSATPSSPFGWLIFYSELLTGPRISRTDLVQYSTLPVDWFNCLKASSLWESQTWFPAAGSHHSRRAIEDDAALAFAHLLAVPALAPNGDNHGG
jgi:uncharacterized protein (TIGR02996 family)